MTHISQNVALPGALSALGGMTLDGYVSADGSLFAYSMPSAGPRNQPPIVTSTLGFSVAGLNLPYIGVGRKGVVNLALVPGEQIQFESIDFDNRFAVKTTDRRAAVMLIDEGMMQWFLDCDRVSLTIKGHGFSATVQGSGPRGNGVPDFDLLLRFQEGFLPRVPEQVRSEFAAPPGQ